MKLASQKQIDFLTKLYEQKGEDVPDLTNMGSWDASKEIDRLMQLKTVNFGDDHQYHSQEEIRDVKAQERQERHEAEAQLEHDQAQDAAEAAQEPAPAEIPTDKDPF